MMVFGELRLRPDTVRVTLRQPKKRHAPLRGAEPLLPGYLANAEETTRRDQPVQLCADRGRTAE